jgi:pyruvate dehydrogenase E2 component (dihydrolipoamide acetyltransferase)
VERGAVIAEIETDKADMEMEAFDSGVLIGIRVPEGGTAAVGDVIGWVGEPGEKAPAAAAPAVARSAGAEPAETAPEASAAAEAEPARREREAPASAGARAPKEMGRAAAAGRPAAVRPERRTSRPAGANGGNAAIPGPHADIAEAIEAEVGEEEEGEEGYATQAPPGAPARAGRQTKGLNDRLPPHSAREERPQRLKISPVARRLAEEGGLDPAGLEGSGPDGRIVKSDVERALERRRKGPDGRRGAAAGAPSGAGRSPAEPAAESPPAVPVARGELGTAIEHSRLRRAVASRMAESKRTVPHFYTTVAVRMDYALRLKDALALRDPDARVSVSHLIVKASALALERWPRVNAVFEEDRIRIPGGIHVGLAVAVEDGLIVPVIRDCQAKGLREIASEARALVERVRRGRLAQDDLQGATFSVSNMGMFEIESFAAIIAPPQAAILAVGGIADEAVVRDGRVVPGKVMRLTLSADHRAIDGSLAAAFLVEVRRFLENPLSLVV